MTRHRNGTVDIFAATSPISRSSDVDNGRQDGGAALEAGDGGSVLILVRGDVYH